MTNGRSSHEDEDEHEDEERRRTFSGCEGEPLTFFSSSTFVRPDSLLSHARGTFEGRRTGGLLERRRAALGVRDQPFGLVAAIGWPTKKLQLDGRLHQAEASWR
jgi:hypothetical protein